MSKRVGVLATAIAMLGVVALPSPASASVEFGDNCTVNNDLTTPFTLFEISNPANTMPTAAPTAGVITQLKMNVIPAPVAFPMIFRVAEPAAPGQYRLVGESQQTVTGGANSFDVRIPVGAGVRLGLAAAFEEDSLKCESAASQIAGLVGNPGIGNTAPVIEGPAPFRVPVFARLEPDADHDGFGDETQDKCPQSAASQIACPSITIDSVSVAGKSAVTVYVSVSSDAPVAVSGSVKLAKGKPLTLKAPAKTLSPGPLGKFKLKFSAKLKASLKELEPGKSLKLKIKASATNVAGVVSTDNSKVTLKGQG